MKASFKDENSELYLADSLILLKDFPSEYVDVIFADPPYFLSNDGFTCKGGKAVSVNKGDWDKAATLEEKHEFNRHWINLCRKILKPNGTIWISGTLHNIYSVGMALEQYHLAKDQSAAEFELQIFHTQHRDNSLGKKKRQSQTLFQLRAYEGTQRRQANERRLVGYLDGHFDAAMRKNFRQTPDAKAALFA